MIRFEQVQGVSFPRSGHHLLVGHLRDYFSCVPCRGERFRELLLRIFGGSRRRFQQFEYCNYYQHCGRHWCRNASTVFQKNHDLELTLPIHSGRFHLIQIREALPAIISWYELAIQRGWDNAVDSSDGWKRFFDQKLHFYLKFSAKWLAPEIGSFSLVSWYEQYVKDPVATLVPLIRVFAPAHEVRLDILQDVAGTNPDIRRVTDFRYYSSEMEAQVQALIRPVLTAVGRHGI